MPRSKRIIPTLAVLVVCTFLLAAGVSCNAITLSPKVQHYSADAEFKGKFLGVRTGTYEAEFDYAAIGLELAWQANRDLELFTDLGVAGADEESLDVGINGLEVGLGMRSADPVDPGWGIDWGIRLHSHYLEDENTISGVRYDNEFTGSGVDFNVGVYHAFPLENDLLLKASLGGYAKSLDGEWEADLVNTKVLDIDYELESEALYAGIALVPAGEEGIDLSALYYQGTEDVRGVVVTAGVRF